MAVTITQQITNAVPMAEYAKTMPMGESRTFVMNMVMTSDLFAAIPVKPAVNGKASFMDIAQLPTVGFRGINQAGNTNTGRFNLREEDTFFIDEYVFADRALNDRLGGEHRIKQERLKSIALGQMASQIIVKGDRTSTPTQPSGLQARCNQASVNYFSNSAASGGGVLSLQNLDILSWAVNQQTHWLFPRSLMPYMDAAARNNSIVNQAVDYTKDDFGRRVMKYKGYPILFGYEPDDTPDLLPFTEVGVGGGTAQCASIYALSLKEDHLYLIEQTPLSVEDEGKVVGQPFLSTHIKWDWGVAREHPRSVARLDSVKLGAIVA